MTANHVLGLKAVLATGEVVEWGSGSRENVGPDWCGLFTGNEGLFGIALAAFDPLGIANPRPSDTLSPTGGEGRGEGDAQQHWIERQVLSALGQCQRDFTHGRANMRCLIQLEMHLAKLGSPMPVRHTMQVLRDAYNSRTEFKSP